MQLHDIPGTHYITAYIPAAAAADASADVTALVAPFRCKVESVEYVPLTLVTGADTNSRNLNLKNGATEVANVDFVSGANAAAKTAKALTLSATEADLVVAAGAVLAVQSEKVGTGLALPAGTVRIGIRGY